MKALVLGGLLGVLEACGVTKEDVEKMPVTSIETLAQDPEMHSQVIVHTKGSPRRSWEGIRS